eukprot:5370595-Pyramimonas_sp.AAC.1
MLAKRRGMEVRCIDVVDHSGFDETPLPLRLTGAAAPSIPECRAVAIVPPGRFTGEVIAQLFQTQSESGCLFGAPPLGADGPL